MNFEELDKMSGFEKKLSVKFPFLKFISAESSKNQSPVKSFVLLRTDDDGNLTAKNLGTEVKATFISSGKFKLKKASYTTNEITPQKDKEVEVYLFSRKTNKRSFQDKGLWRTMKEKYDLSTYQYPYILIGGEIVKFGVLPSSLNNYWEYKNSFKESERIYQFETILRGSEDSKESEGGVYYSIVFERGDKLNPRDLEKTAEKIVELKGIQDQQEKQFESQKEERVEDELPIIDIDKETKEEEIEDEESFRKAFGLDE